MRDRAIAAAVVMLAASCDQQFHRLADAPARGDDAAARDGALGDAGGSGSGSQALGCAVADVAAQCSATLVVDTVAMQETDFTMMLGSSAPPTYTYVNTDENNPGIMYSYDRVFTLTCSTGSDGSRQWAGQFSDSCYSTNDVGNFTPDHTGASFAGHTGACPSGSYAETTSEQGNPSGGDSTCESPPTSGASMIAM